MFGKKTEPLEEKKETILKSYNKINEGVVYRIVESLKEAKELENEEVRILQQAGITTVILARGKQFTYLAPGQDPYQTRAQIESFFKAKERKSNTTKKAEVSSNTSSVSKKTNLGA